MITLLPDQEEDSSLMATMGDLPNFSLAGTGKTLSALGAVKKSGHQRGMIFGPVVSLKMWKKEIEAYLGASAAVLKSASGVIPDADFLIASYGLASGNGMVRLRKHFAQKRSGTQALILDESHYARTPSTKRSTAIYGVDMTGEDSMIEWFDQVWPMSGNPIFKYADDMWGVMRALYPEVLAKYHSLSYNEFVMNFCFKRKKQYHPRMPPQWVVSGNVNEATLKRMIYDEIGAIRRTEIQGMPDVIVRELELDLKASNMTYAAEVRKMSLETIVELMNKKDPELVKAIKTMNLAKLHETVDYIVDITKTCPVLVGVWYDEVGDAALKEYRKAGLTVERVYGATPIKKREEIRDRFNAGELDVIVGQEEAMNASWNLQECCHHVVILEDNFSPSVIEQFYKRVARRGQKKKTLVDILKATHPLDDAITRVRESKGHSMSLILD